MAPDFRKEHAFLQQLDTKDLFGDAFTNDEYCSLDLSINNRALGAFDLSDPEDCQRYIDSELQAKGARIAFGGYLERRNLYKHSDQFQTGKERNIHLGVDFWTNAGTEVFVPYAGKVHSFKNNAQTGDYGPTIILIHEFQGKSFHTLYGHLSEASLESLTIGRHFEAGTLLATLGTPDINVNYAPHLHFQLILDMGQYHGDYPGVSASETLDFYRKNCPNPDLFLRRL
ncbi:MAG: peptidoglycan DD-metalloendopeptidase family protein [Flavobacteriaceae bacterium]|nr:peptidoglycan DD-metalloendopeptidase family protein [Flavobacteriaceae bacterium]